MAKEPKKLTDLRAEEAALKKQQAEACSAELEPVLKKHGCRLVGVPRVENGKIVADVVLSVE